MYVTFTTRNSIYEVDRNGALLSTSNTSTPISTGAKLVTGLRVGERAVFTAGMGQKWVTTPIASVAVEKGTHSSLHKLHDTSPDVVFSS